MSDLLTRVITESGNTFAIACDTTELVNTACQKHDVGPLAAVALGRALTGAVLMGALLKGDQYVQLKFEGNGPLGKIITEGSPSGWCRGYVANPHADLPLIDNRLDVAGGLGRAGLLTVTKDIGMKHKYQGTIHLVSSEIGEDLAYYLTTSEQIPSAVALGIHLNTDGTIAAAGGYLIQSLPPANEELIEKIEETMAQLPLVSAMLLAGNSPRTILDRLFPFIPHRETLSTKLSYQCSCSRDKMEQAIYSLGKDEIQSLLEQEGIAEVHCEFCRDTYNFSADELQAIINDIKKKE